MGYEIGNGCKIGFSWVFPTELIMKSGSKISHFTVVKGIKKLYLGRYSLIGKGNWITGYPFDGQEHFTKQKDRIPQLLIGEHSAITNNHILDCTNTVSIGNFTTIAGFGSQIITHSIDFTNCIQWSKEVHVGNYCFVGTCSVILAGSSLPDYSILGAKSLLNKCYFDKFQLFTGVPAIPKKGLPQNLKYFCRNEGYVF